MIKQLIFTLIYHIIVNRGENMVFFKGLAIKNYNDYSNKDTKLLRDIKDKKLFKMLRMGDIPYFMPLCGCMCDIWFKWHYKLWIYGFRYAGSQLLDKCNV